MTAVARKPVTTWETLPKWIMPVKAGRIKLIETVSPDDLETTRKVLQAWARIYGDFPKGVGPGGYIPHRLSQSMEEGRRILVALDAKRIPQAFAQISCIAASPNGLYVDELVVAPWNHAVCCKFIADHSDFDLEEFLLSKSDVLGLMSAYQTTLAGLFTPSRGTGTLMMYAVCALVYLIGKETLTLVPLPEVYGFYAKFGMETGRLTLEQGGEITVWPTLFYRNCSKIPDGLLLQLRKYFPGFR